LLVGRRNSISRRTKKAQANSMAMLFPVASLIFEDLSSSESGESTWQAGRAVKSRTGGRGREVSK